MGLYAASTRLAAASLYALSSLRRHRHRHRHQHHTTTLCSRQTAATRSFCCSPRHTRRAHTCSSALSSLLARPPPRCRLSASLHRASLKLSALAHASPSRMLATRSYLSLTPAPRLSARSYSSAPPRSPHSSPPLHVPAPPRSVAVATSRTAQPASGTANAAAAAGYAEGRRRSFRWLGDTAVSASASTCQLVAAHSSPLSHLPPSARLCAAAAFASALCAHSDVPANGGGALRWAPTHRHGDQVRSRKHSTGRS